MTVTTLPGENVDAWNGKLTFEQSKNRIVGRDHNNVIRLLILGNGTQFVMKVSEEGVDALTATDDELVFNSNNNLFKIVHSGTHNFFPADFAPSGNAYLDWLATFNYVHGLTEPPIILGFMEDALGQIRQLPFYAFNYDTGALSYQVIATVNSVSMQIEIRSTTPLGPILPVRYYILQETAGI